MQSNKNSQEIQNYYIVCRPISFSSQLDNEDIAAILDAVKDQLVNTGAVYNVFLDKEQAMLAASQFSAREVLPAFFDKQYYKTHDIAKPILCLSLDHTIRLTDKSESCYFINGKKTVCTSYQATVYDLFPWQNSNSTLLIDGKEYLIPDNQASFHKTTSLTQI